MHRRAFLGSSARAAGGFAAGGALVPAPRAALDSALARVAGLPDADVARDESFWRPVQQSYAVTRGVVNLDNGNIGACPRVVTDALLHYARLGRTGSPSCLPCGFSPLSNPG